MRKNIIESKELSITGMCSFKALNDFLGAGSAGI